MSKTTADRVLKGITQTYMDKTGNPSPTYGTAVQEIGDAIGGGKGTIPFSNIFDCLESTELAGLKQSTAPTTTGDNPQVYEDENHIWHNLYWLDDSVTPNVWKKYNTATGQWELV